MVLAERNKRQEIIHDFLVGLFRGTEAVHTLPSFFVTLKDQRDQDELIARTKLEKIVKALTIVGESATYAYLAHKGIPAYAIPAVTNSIDLAAYLWDKIEQHDLATSMFPPDWWLLCLPKPDKVYWNEGAGFERWFPSLYGNLIL